MTVHAGGHGRTVAKRGFRRGGLRRSTIIICPQKEAVVGCYREERIRDTRPGGLFDPRGSREQIGVLISGFCGENAKQLPEYRAC